MMPRQKAHPGLVFGAASKNRTSWRARNVVRAALPRWSGTAIACANPVVQVAISGGASLVPVMDAADLRNGNYSAGISSLHGPGFRRVLIQREVSPGEVVIRHERLHTAIQRASLKTIT